MNNRSSSPQPQDNLNKALGYSLAFHAAVLIFLAVRVVFFPSEPMETLSAIRVDMVALPDKQTAQLPPSAPAPEEKPAPENPPPEPVKPKPELPKPVPPPAVPVHPVPITKPDSPKINLKKNKQDEASALKRLEAMEKLEKMTKAEKQHPSTKSPSASTAPASQPIKGNEIAHGGALSGISKLDNDNYIQTVTDHVKQHWNLPRWLRADNLRAVVKVFVDSSGAVLKKQLIVSSHNETYDELVLTAVDRASPFPAPPPELATRLSVYGFDLDITP